MKKLTLILLTALLPATLLFAQTPQSSSKRLSFEARIGFGPGFLSQDLTHSENVNSNAAIGFSYEVGASALYALGKNFSLEAGLFYQQRGGGIKTELSGIGSGYTDKISMHFHYLTIPIHARYYLLDRKLYAYGGLGLGFCLSASQKYKQDGGAGETVSLNEQRKKFGLSFDLGAGYTIFNDFSIGLGTNIGLTSAISNSRSKTSFHTLLLFAAYKF